MASVICANKEIEYVNLYAYTNGETTIKSDLKTINLFENIEFDFKIESLIGSCVPIISINSGNPIYEKINANIKVLNRTVCQVVFDCSAFELAKLGYVNSCADSYKTDEGVGRLYVFDYDAHNVYGYEDDESINEQINAVLDKTVKDYVECIKVIQDSDDNAEYPIDSYELVSLDEDKAEYMFHCGDKSYTLSFKHNLFVLPTGEVVCSYKYTLIGNYLGIARDGQIKD